VGQVPVPDHDPRPVAGTVAVLVAVSIWGGMAVVVRWVDEIDGLALGFHRLWIGAAGTLAVFYALGRRLSWRTLRLSVPGGLAFGADIVLFFSALKHTTVANATVVGALQPILVFFIADRMFGEAVTRRLVVWSVIAIGGVAVVVYGSSGVPVWSIGGDLLAIAALVSWTAYFVASKRVRTELHPFDYLTALLLIATVAVAPVALLSGQRLDPGGAEAWMWIAVLALGSGGVGHLLINWAHGHVELAVMSLLTLAVPVVAVLSAAVFLDEPVTWEQAIGMAIVLVALAVVAVQTSRSAPTVPSESEDVAVEPVL
jgi:drug/metabolite transporter (DMT)-like permease